MNSAQLTLSPVWDQQLWAVPTGKGQLKREAKGHMARCLVGSEEEPPLVSVEADVSVLQLELIQFLSFPSMSVSALV